MTHTRSLRWRHAGLSLLISLFVPTGLAAQAEGAAKAKAPGAPILDALNSVDDDTRRFNEHIVMLSSPFMEGRVPGSRGMEIAKEYMEFWFKESGLVAPFATSTEGSHGVSFRQAFPLSSTSQVVGATAKVGDRALAKGTDFAPHNAPTGGETTGALVSVGYSITRGRGGYNSYPDDDDLSGKIALVLRGTPVGDGDRRWRQSRRYSIQVKVHNAFQRGAAGVIVVAPSYVKTAQLATARHRRSKGPVISMTRSAADAMLASVGAGQTIDALAKANDVEGKTMELGAKKIEFAVEVKSKRLMAENVAALLKGRGARAKELIVIGAHLDHLGMGNFGSRSRQRGKVVHPGADDNASGSAAVLMIAEKMASAYAKNPDQPMRSVLFMGFSAEESGLNGSKFYANNMLEGYEHVLMINFDMVGRVRKNRLQVMGVGTAKGMKQLVQPICDKHSLEVRMSAGAGGGSDHLNFLRKGIPVLMGHSGMHGDYHTERDISDKINRVGGGQAAELFAQLGLAAASWDQSFEFQGSSSRRRR